MLRLDLIRSSIRFLIPCTVNVIDSYLVPHQLEVPKWLLKFSIFLIQSYCPLVCPRANERAIFFLNIKIVLNPVRYALLF